MLRGYLFGIGLTLLIMIPVSIVGGLMVGYVKAQLWNESPEEMATVQNVINSLFDSIISFVFSNWFYICIIIILSLIAYILFHIWERISCTPR